MKKIGLIGGLSWESSQDYYRLINEGVSSRLGGLHSAECAMTSLDFAPIAEAMASEDWDSCRDRVLASAVSLKKAGADFLLICSNTMHVFADDVQSETGLPLLHIADSIGRAAQAGGADSVALLGTRALMESDHYRRRLEERWGLSVSLPGPEGRKLVDDVIFGELCRGEVNERSRDAFLDIMNSMAEDGAQAIVLGCTEIPMLIGQDDTELPLLNSTWLHCRDAVDMALR